MARLSVLVLWIMNIKDAVAQPDLEGNRRLQEPR